MKYDDKTTFGFVLNFSQHTEYLYVKLKKELDKFAFFKSTIK